MKILEEISAQSIEAIAEKYFLSVKSSVKFPELVCLCYDQLNTPKNQSTNECRGLVLAENKVICYPFYRFFDYNPKLDILDFVNGKFYEKIDGSICVLYWYKDSWHISTKTTPTGEGYIGKNTSISVSDYFFEVLGARIEKLNPKYTYICEFKFPSDISYLVKSTEPSITLIGIREQETLKELNIESFSNIFDVLQSKKFNSVEELNNYVCGLNPNVSEGLVYVSNELDKNNNFVRYKIKSPQFELIRLLNVKNVNDPLNEKRLNFICRVNSHRTFLEGKYEVLGSLATKIDETISKVKKEIEEHSHLTEKKEVGLLNISTEAKTELFRLLDKKPKVLIW